MAKKNLLTYFVAVALAPLFFACAHATNEAAVDGFEDSVAMDGNPALRDPSADLKLAAGSEEVSDKQVAEAQKKVVEENAATFKKVEHPFSPPPPAEVPVVATHKAKKVKAKKIIWEPVAEVVKVPLNEAPGTLVTRNGSLLNRYYFLRAGDSPEILSKMIYGSVDRAAELVDWNGPAVGWVPGQVLYYRSPKSAQDDKMLSYYFEAGVATQTVTVGQGDTLRKIADKRFGSPNSWREIATLNGLRTGSDPTEGMTLKVYPFPLVKQEAPAVVANVNAMEKKMPEPKAPQEASGELGGFIHHNPLVVACSVVALFLLLGFFLIQRRRYSRFDF